jgi:hypothetical protein
VEPFRTLLPAKCIDSPARVVEKSPALGTFPSVCGWKLEVLEGMEPNPESVGPLEFGKVFEVGLVLVSRPCTDFRFIPHDRRRVHSWVLLPFYAHGRRLSKRQVEACCVAFTRTLRT